MKTTREYEKLSHFNKPFHLCKNHEAGLKKMLVCRHPTDPTGKPADPKNFIAIPKKNFFSSKISNLQQGNI